MQAQQQKPPIFQQQQLHKDIKNINHFSFQISLPQTASISSYFPMHQTQSKKKKKIKHKFQAFTYYQDHSTKTISKILFIDNDTFVDQGQYPFTDPSGNLRKFAELNAKRLQITEAAYIGHVNDQLIVKKMEGGVKIGGFEEVQTVDDQFELIKIGNPQRFNQFLKLMSLNKNAINLSIRVIIDETDPTQPQVIDYEFFFREKALIKKHGPETK